MYLDAHVMPSIVLSALFPRSSSNIHWDAILIRSPLKKVFYLDVGIAKKCFGCKMSTFFGIKSEELFLRKSNMLCVLFKMLQFRSQAKNNSTVVFYASLTNYTFGNVVLFAKMRFNRHFNHMPIVGSLIWSYSEFLKRKEKSRMGVAHSLCNYVTRTGQRRSYLGSLCSRAYTKRNTFLCTSTFVEVGYTTAKRTTLIIPPEKF